MDLGLPQSPAVEISALARVFKAGRGGGEVVALAGVDLRIERGEIFGLRGPNGAGKTTCIKILTTLLFPTGGVAKVAGFDVVAQAAEVQRRINLVSGGESSGYGILTVRECLWMFSQFDGVPTREARQRMNFVRGFVSDPEVLFLDEPTLGMDVNAARRLREFVGAWVRERPGRTVLLTTHYVAEADELCDRIAIVDRGRVLAAAQARRVAGLADRIELGRTAHVRGLLGAAPRGHRADPGRHVLGSRPPRGPARGVRRVLCRQRIP